MYKLTLHRLIFKYYNWMEKIIDENLRCKEIKIFSMSKDDPIFKNKTYSYVQNELKKF